MVSLRNKSNPYFQKQKHIRLAKKDVTKQYILTAVPGVEYIQNRVETTGFEATSKAASNVLKDAFFSEDGYTIFTNEVSRKPNAVYPVGQTFYVDLAPEEETLYCNFSVENAWTGSENDDAYVVELEFTLVSGSLSGAGIQLKWDSTWRLAALADHLQAPLVLGERNVFRAVMNRPSNHDPNDFVANDPNLILNSSSFGGYAVKHLEVHRLYIRPANAEELTIKTGKVFEASVWLRPDNASSQYGVFSFVSGWEYSFLRRATNGTMVFQLEDTFGNRLLSVSTNQQVSDGSWHHVYCYFDNSNVGSGSYTLEVDGVLGTVNEIAGPTYNGNDIGVNAGFLVGNAPNSEFWVGGMADLFVNVEENSRFGRSAFVDGDGDPLDPGNLDTTPILLLGSIMTASDWNNGTNFGEAEITVDFGSMSDV